jgi:tripartite-type tricarboxylate transporter receptor subunit TctC
MSELLNRTVVVDNRPGAGGQIAATALKAAAPDGNTLFLSNSHALAMIPLTVRQPGYDTAKDFTPVGLVAIQNDVLAVNPAVVGDVRDISGLVKWANTQPGQGNVGVPAPASDPDFGVRIISKELKGDLTPVPYRGDAPVIQDLLAGQIPAGMGSVGAVMQYVRSDKLRVIAVSGPTRIASLPNVPTYMEQGIKGYGISGYSALMAPTGTPHELIKRYNEVVSRVVSSKNFSVKVQELGVIPTSSTPDELATRIRETSAAFSSMVQRVDYKMP